MTPPSDDARPMSRKVAVIGAGPAGLVTSKELLDEGHRVVCFDASDGAGGLFRCGEGAAYPDLKLTTSNYYTAFSSLPPPLTEERDFWTRERYLHYLQHFAQRYGLPGVTRFGARVTDVQPVDDGFAVTWIDSGDVERSERFDAVAVCRGAFRATSPRLPDIEGLDRFSGEVLHSADYAGAERFSGRRVVCVGLGETASDVLAQVSKVAARCWLSVRRRSWLIARRPRGRPFPNDAYSARLRHWNPDPQLGSGERIRRKWAALRASSHYAGFGAVQRFIIDWNLQAESLGHASAMKNCAFIDGVLEGRIDVVPHAIDRVEGDEVRFADGSTVRADTILLCTGYEEGSFPAPAGWFGIEPVADVRTLYKHAFHPELRERVAFIGWVRPEIGGAPPCFEMLARYFGLLLSGKRRLPPRAELAALIQDEGERERRDFWGHPDASTLVRYTSFMDGVAELVGCEPHLEDHLDEPELLYKLICGSNIGPCYRLRGPHAMPDLARRVILRLPVAFLPLTIRNSLPAMLDARYGRELSARMQAIVEPFIEDEQSDPTG